MKYISKFNLFQEARGVADPTLYIVDPIYNFVMEKSFDFRDKISIDKKLKNILNKTWNLEDLKKYKPSNFSRFPVSKVRLNLKLIKDTDDYTFALGAHAFDFIDEAGHSKFKKGVKENNDHTISISMGIQVYFGKIEMKEADINKFKVELEATILHELNHLYEFYHRTFDKQNRSVQTSITWASIGDRPKDIPKEIFEYWQDNFATYIYKSEPHEIRAQIQEAKAHIDRIGIKDLKNSTMWKVFKKMEKFDENKFFDDFHKKSLSLDLIESDILHELIKNWKKEYRNLYSQQIEKNKPSSDLFDKMSDAKFIQYWAKKIREAGSKLSRGVLRLYSNKKED